MNITKVTYGKTINIGNFQSIRVEFTADVGEDEQSIEVLQHLKTCLKSAEIVIKQENGVKS